MMGHMENIEKKHIITIAGGPGSGKSTTAKAVAEKLGYDHFSSGDLFRAIMKDLGYDVLEGNKKAEERKDVDHLVDQRLQKIGAEEDNKVIDSRMAWHWIPGSYKVYLNLDLLAAAHRILGGEHDPNRLAHEKVQETPEEYARDLQARLDSETRRYEDLYQANPSDLSNYDLVIDSAENNIDQVVELVINGFHKWLESSDRLGTR